MLLTEGELESPEKARLDVTDLDLLDRTIDEHEITNAIDLAAAHGGVLGTLYGVYNEVTAALYWHDWGVASAGLRLHTVYGLGRDQGLASAPARAMDAAAPPCLFLFRSGSVPVSVRPGRGGLVHQSLPGTGRRRVGPQAQKSARTHGAHRRGDRGRGTGVAGIITYTISRCRFPRTSMPVRGPSWWITRPSLVRHADSDRRSPRPVECFRRLLSEGKLLLELAALQS